MLTVTNLAALLATMPTPTGSSAATSSPDAPALHECGKVNVFYTGFPPYHPLVSAQGWDPIRVDIGLRKDVKALTEAGYNVHTVWAGPETPVSVIESRLKEKGIDYDVLGVGWGMRGATIEIIVRRFEALVDMYKRAMPHLPIVFNWSPESTLWSVEHRAPMREDCKAAGKLGRLIGWEEICDERCDENKAASHDEL